MNEENTLDIKFSGEKYEIKNQKDPNTYTPKGKSEGKKIEVKDVKNG
jgi:hypothetical protein